MKIKSFYIKSNYKIQKPSNLKLVNKETNMGDDINLQETEKS
jgi:hypothetical protein